jgi:hypothetical protein
MAYIEIINNTIVQYHSVLPQSYRNISNFFALEPDQLANLSWSGNDGIKFYFYNEQRPEVLPPNSTLIGPKYTIDDDNHVVIGSFEVQQIDLENIKKTVPKTITATQVRLWLIENNIPLSTIETALNNIENPILREKTKIQWEYAPYIERSHPLIESIAIILGLDSSQLDSAFIEASKL